VNLLRVALEDSVDPAIRQVAAISFKNAAKRDWEGEGAGAVTPQPSTWCCRYLEGRGCRAYSARRGQAGRPLCQPTGALGVLYREREQRLQVL
jgi:hypothetical protein